jgi:hypothetical protein
MTRYPTLCCLLAGLSLALPVNAVPAQEWYAARAETPREPVLPPNLAWFQAAGPGEPAAGPGRAARFQLFRMPTSPLGDPVGLDQDDDPLDPSAPAPPVDNDPTGAWLQLAMGNDNPYFDFRRRSHPGGVGFYRVHSQMQLLDTGATACTFGLQAFTPAGLESDGLRNGPTVVSPSLALFQEIGPNLAVHGFIGKCVAAPVNHRGGEGAVDRSLQYGVALQTPLPVFRPGEVASLHFFVEALGRYRHEDVGNGLGPSALELLPGLHWQLGENLWMSGGVSVPVRASSRWESGLWQLTCSWRF